MPKKKMSRIARINATLDRFARLIEANARDLRRDKAEAKRQRAKDKAEAKRQRAKDRAEDAKRRAEDQAKWERQVAEWERQRALEKAEAKAEAKAKAEAEAKAEAKRKKAEDERMANSEKSLQEMKASVSNLGRHVRGMGISIGDITEAVTVSDKIIGLVKDFAGIDVNSFDANLERTYMLDPSGELEGTNRKQYEIDGLIVGKTAVMLIEAKTKLNKGDITDFLKGLPRFKEAFREYKDRDVYAGVAFVRSNDKTLAYAEKKGLFIIKATPPDVTLINSEGFKPTKFA